MPRPSPSDRAAKVAKVKKASRSAELRRGGLIWVSAAVVLLIVAGLVGWAILSSRLNVQTYDYSGGMHKDTVLEYTESPPVGGEHNNAWWNCGVYPDPIPNEHAVHSLEHGAVWLTYRPDLSEDQVAVLEELGNEEYMLVSPYPDQDAPIVATVWNRQMKLDGMDEAKLEKFIRDYRQGPQTPEPGAACTGGTSTDLVDRS